MEETRICGSALPPCRIGSTIVRECGRRSTAFMSWPEASHLGRSGRPGFSSDMDFPSGAKRFFGRAGTSFRRSVRLRNHWPHCWRDRIAVRKRWLFGGRWRWGLHVMACWWWQGVSTRTVLSRMPSRSCMRARTNSPAIRSSLEPTATPECWLGKGRPSGQQPWRWRARLIHPVRWTVRSGLA